jgi:hypothetical protein
METNYQYAEGHLRILKKLEKEFDVFFHPKQEGDNGRIFKLISFACWLSANDAK